MAYLDQDRANIALILSSAGYRSGASQNPYGWTPSAIGVMRDTVADMRGEMYNGAIANYIWEQAAKYGISDASLTSLLTAAGFGPELSRPAPSGVGVPILVVPGGGGPDYPPGTVLPGTTTTQQSAGGSSWLIWLGLAAAAYFLMKD